ncbi:hypothetical protein [Pseudomonas phage Max]
MKRGIYRGPIPHLIGKTALLREATHGHVVAQFDDWSLTRSGDPIPRTRTVLEYEPHARFPTEQQEPLPEPPADALGYGWHAFPAEDFEENRTCPTCEATGFQQSTLGPDRCTFCDGTEGGNPPEEEDA